MRYEISHFTRLYEISILSMKPEADLIKNSENPDLTRIEKEFYSKKNKNDENRKNYASFIYSDKAPVNKGIRTRLKSRFKKALLL